MVKLSPVTTLVGLTDSGKSSVLRALYWLCFNRPLGDYFVKYGEDGCEVLAVLDEVKLKRTRNKEENSYTLNGKEFKALGRDVPEEVQNVLNLTNDNFQRQHDSHFWLNLSSGDLSRELNRIVNLELMDRVNQNLSTRVRAKKSEVSVSESHLEQAKKKKESLTWVLKAEVDLSILLNKESIVLDKASRIDSLADLIKEGGKAGVELDNRLQEVTDAGNVIQIGEGLVNKQKEMDSLYRLIQEGRQTCESLVRARYQLRDLNEKLKEVRTCPTCGALTSS